MEANVVLWNDQVEPFGRLFDLNQLQNLHVVLKDFTSHGKWTDVNNVYLGVFDSENSGDLGILFLLELLYCHSFHF